MAAQRRRWTSVCCLLVFLTGCGRYADFALPPPDPAGPRPPFAWEPLRVLSCHAATPIDVLNPSVVRFHGEYLNLYSEYDGHTWHTATASSPDGVHWSKTGRVLSPSGWEGNYIAANGSALVDGSEILYWYEAGDPFQHRCWLDPPTGSIGKSAKTLSFAPARAAVSMNAGSAILT